MNYETGSRGSLRFSIFGIPAEIQPSSWVILGLLGLSMYSTIPSPLQPTLIFVVVGMLTVLAHELGHALASRAFTRVTPIIIIGNLGGITYSPVPMPTRAKNFLMVLAGPVAGFALGLAIAVLLGVQIGDVWAAITIYVMEPLSFIPAVQVPMDSYIALGQAMEAGAVTRFALMLYSSFFMVCFWWTLFSLMPILPMDGGQLLLTATNNPKLSAGIGLCIGALLCLWFLMHGGIFMTLMLGWLAWYNWRILKQFS